MVEKVRGYLMNLPPATWISLISICIAGALAFGAMQTVGAGNSREIEKLAALVAQNNAALHGRVTKVSDECEEKVDAISDDFREHCAWGTAAKAEQDKDRALIKKDLDYIQGAMKRQEARLDRQDAVLEHIRKLQEQILRDVNGRK